MSYFGIESESDLEMAIDYAVQIVKRDSPTKILTLAFNNEGMMHIFLENLFKEFHSEGLGKDSGLCLNIQITEEA